MRLVKNAQDCCVYKPSCLCCSLILREHPDDVQSAIQAQRAAARAADFASAGNASGDKTHKLRQSASCRQVRSHARIVSRLHDHTVQPFMWSCGVGVAEHMICRMVHAACMPRCLNFPGPKRRGSSYSSQAARPAPGQRSHRALAGHRPLCRAVLCAVVPRGSRARPSDPTSKRGRVRQEKQHLGPDRLGAWERLTLGRFSACIDNL
jgi:hypothetical protein